MDFTFNINNNYSLISPYAVMILLSLFFGNIVMYILNIKNGIRKNVSGYTILLSLMMSIFCGIYMAYITSGFRYYGLSSIGGLIGMYLAVLVMSIISHSKKDMKIMFQNCTLVLPLMYAISKTGCFLAGCCYGIKYSGIFSVYYTGHGNIPEYNVFPVQLAESIIFFLIFVIGMFLYRYKSKNIIQTEFIVSALSKLLLDFLRESHNGQLISLNQILCIILMIIAIFLKQIIKKLVFSNERI